MQQRLFHLAFYKGSSSRLSYNILCWGSIVGVQLHKFWGWMLSSYISKWGDCHCSRCGLSSSARRYNAHRCCNIFAVFFFSYTLMQTGFSTNQKCYLKEFWWMLHNPVWGNTIFARKMYWKLVLQFPQTPINNISLFLRNSWLKSSGVNLYAMHSTSSLTHELHCNMLQMCLQFPGHLQQPWK